MAEASVITHLAAKHKNTVHAIQLCRLCNGKQPSFTDIFYITVHNKQHTTLNYRKTKHHD